MGLSKKIIAAFLLFAMALFGKEKQEIQSSHILYLLDSNELKKAFSLYQDLYKQTKNQDFGILEKIAVLLLEKGAKSNDIEIQKLTMLGAGLAASTHSVDILEKGLDSTDGQNQMTSLHFLSQLEDDRIDTFLSKAMRSDFLLTRLEAAYEMAQRKHPHAVGQIESLMHKLPPPFKPIFPQLFALADTPKATTILKELFADPNVDVRIEAVLSAMRYERDDLLSVIRQKAPHASAQEQEAYAQALGILKDTSSIPLLETYLKRGTAQVKISAIESLYRLGRTKVLEELKKIALNKNPFAISAMSISPTNADTLALLLTDEDPNIRLNAAATLLKLKDRRCLETIKMILSINPQEILICPYPSPGRSMLCWKFFPAAILNLQDDSSPYILSLNLKEYFLTEALELGEKDFLDLATFILEEKINDLVPHLMELLENIQTEETISLIKKFSQKEGAPLVRDYCNLSLFRLKQKGNYEEMIYQWIKTHQNQEMIRLHPCLPWKSRITTKYKLSADETSRLLIETFIALASSHKKNCIELLIEAIKEGNEKNRYVLAGLLLRAIE